MGRKSLEASLVRISTVEGEVVGAGFLVGKRQVLTCAHVITQALSLPDNVLDPPSASVVLDFPLLAPRMRLALAARIVLWQPVEAENNGDIAGLELLGDPPPGAEAAHFTAAEDVWGHPFSAFGFPRGQDAGVWATGLLRSRQASNWLFVEDTKTEGFAVIQGFSGGPVWDTQLQGVVGMVVAASQPTETKTAFVIPFSVLAAAWPCIQPVAHQRVFLSAAPEDTGFAKRLKADLQAQDIVVWDELDHMPNTDLHAQEEEQQHPIRNAQAVLLVASSQSFYAPVVKRHLHLAEIYQRRLILAWRDSAEHTQPHYAECRDTALVDLQNLSYDTALQRIEAALSQNRSLTAIFEPIEKAAGQAPRNPYKGLSPFQKQDAKDFFGRENLITELVKDVTMILAQEAPNKEGVRCLSVIGPSGSGKSSVIMAGLLVQLQHGAIADSECWTYLEPIVPGRHPLKALTRVLKPHFPDGSFKEVLENDTAQGLHQLATRLTKGQKGRVVLLVDQFEELFTQAVTEEERQRFLDLLLTAATIPSGPLLLLLTLRADFYDRPMQYPPLSRLMQAHQEQVLPMNVENLRATIEQPAALTDVQLSFEGNLVGDLLVEIQGQVGALPLLQFTLDQLFEQRDGQRLTLQAYHEIGGVRGALSRHTECTYNELPSNEHRDYARMLFLRLLEPGVSQQDTTRRRAAISEFTFDDSAQTRLMRETIDAFIAARLLTASKVEGITIIEVSHEAVIREWERLANWLHDAREDIQLQQSLSADAARWEQRKRPKDRLYRGAHLKDVQEWSRRNKPSEQEAAFLRASEKNGREEIFRIVDSIIAAVLLLIAFICLYFIVLPSFVLNANDSGVGSLRNSIESASTGSTIYFAPWLNGQTIKLNEDLIFTEGKQLDIDNSAAANISITNTNRAHNDNSYAVIRIPQKTQIRISELKFVNSITHSGAFIVNEGTFSITDSQISGNQEGANIDNYAGNGAGIYNSYSGILTMERCIISHNSEKNIYISVGAGIHNEGKAHVIDSKIEDNKLSANSGYGAGIYNGYQSKLILSDSDIEGNNILSDNDYETYASVGGGMANNGKATVIGSTFSGNEALNNLRQGHSGGGGILNSGGGQLLVVNSTFYKNEAQDYDHTGEGGGIYSAGHNTSTILRFSTLVSNTADQGGAIENDQGDNNSLTMSDNIIAANKAQSDSNISGPANSEGYNYVAGGSRLSSKSDQQLTLADLHLDSQLRHNGGTALTLKLLPKSKAFDAIPANKCRIPITDAFGHTEPIIQGQRDLSRLGTVGKACNVGAH